MTAIELAIAVAGALGAGVGGGLGLAWQQGRRSRRVKSDPEPRLPQAQAQPGFAPGDTGRFEIPRCADHSALVQADKDLRRGFDALAADVSGIRSDMAATREDIAEMRGAMGLRPKVPHGGGGRRA